MKTGQIDTSQLPVNAHGSTLNAKTSPQQFFAFPKDEYAKNHLSFFVPQDFLHEIPVHGLHPRVWPAPMLPRTPQLLYIRGLWMPQARPPLWQEEDNEY